MKRPEPDWARYTPAEMAELAGEYFHDHNDGSDFFFDPLAAGWRYELIDPAMLQAFASPQEARGWMEEEIRCFRLDGAECRAKFYEQMLEQGIAEPVIVGQVDEQGRLWDGWHRTACAMARGERVPAFVGTPSAPEHLHDPAAPDFNRPVAL